jgi:hypothetical protein
MYPPALAECAGFNPNNSPKEFKFNNGDLKWRAFSLYLFLTKNI